MGDRVLLEEMEANKLFDEDMDKIRLELREIIQRRMWELQFMKLSHLAEKMNYSKGRLSEILSHTHPATFTLDVLDKLTEALELGEGALYDYFPYECFNKKGSLEAVKCKNFIKRCIQIDKNDIAYKVIRLLGEQKKSSLPILYAIAEDFYQEKKYDAALSMYQTITQYGISKLNEKLAISYYRIFLISRECMRTRKESAARSAENAIKMIEYLNHLPATERVEAYLELAVFYNLIEDATNTEVYATRLSNFLQEIDRYKAGIDQAKYEYYYAEALLYYSFSLEDQRNFTKTYEIIDMYSKVNDYYLDIGTGNKILVQIHAGDTDQKQIAAFFRWAGERRSYLRPLVPGILEKYLEKGMLDEATQFLTENKELVDWIVSYSDTLSTKYRIRFHLSFGQYLVRTKEFSMGLDNILQAMSLSDHMGNTFRFKQCSMVFTTFFEHASDEQKLTYQNIMGRR